MSKYQAGLDKLRAADEGEKRLDQFVVEEQSRIVEEVSEEEYRRIMERRRDDFVVGSKDLGYADGGREIWEGPEAAREHTKAAAERLSVRGGGAVAKVPVPQQSAATTASLAKEKSSPASSLHQLLQKGSHAVAGAESVAAPARDSHHQKELDEMLQQMCGQIDAGETSSVAPKSSSTNAKRKADAGSVSGRASKKPVVQKPTDGEKFLTTCKRELDDAQQSAVVAKVKVEPTDDIDPVRTNVSVATVKSEIKVELENPVAVKREMPEPKSGASQMRAWLQGGACEGVTVDDTAHSGPADTPMDTRTHAQMLLEEDGGLWFFFVDAFEDDRASPPRLYLFGKVRTTGQSYESCCLVVERVERSVHLLLDVDDIDDEVAVQAKAHEAEVEFVKKCPGVKKLRAKLKYRNYAFEKALRHGKGELPFLKVVYDSAGQTPFAGMRGEAFSHVFGAQTSLLERFLTRQRVMGPSWLRLHPGSWKEDPARLSYCAIELRITPSCVATAKTDDDRRQLTALGMPTASPPLRMISIGMQTFQRSPDQPHEPVAISCTLHPKLNVDAPENDRDLRDGMRQWAAVRRFDTRQLPRDSAQVLAKNGVEQYSSEVSLLNALLAKINEFDPDVVAGHNAYGFDLDVLATRMHQLKMNNGWQKMGRLRRPKDRVPHLEGSRGAGFWAGKSLTAGRLVCDVMLQAKDLLPKVGAYDLATLAREHLGVQNMQVIEPEALPRFFDTAESLNHLAETTFYNALGVARLAHSLQILPLTKQLTNLAGNLWNMSLQNKRAERNEMLLCHEFHKRKFVLPDRENQIARKRRMQPEPTGLEDAAEDAPLAATGPRRGKAAYSGGLVLEPKVGLYDEFVMLLDFNSLYPSIIQEHNICFTTVERPDEHQVAQCSSEADLLAQTHQPDGTLDEGVLPQVLRRLVESRRNVKMAIKTEKDARRRQMLEIRQLALKLTANSMYGCLGFQNSRFYAKPLAALITARGRDALQSTITVVQQELQLDVVYGDTDSVFVNTKTQDYRQAMQAAQQIKTSVNKKYKRLEIEIDAVFGRLMLLKKKKYAALKVLDWEKKTFERELKGLDIVRRDWCDYAKSVGDAILTRILTGEGKEEAVQWAHNFLQERGQEMDEQKVDLQRYVITKGLTKDPKDYPDAKNQPHVQVALRLLARGKAVRPGQEIGYVVCLPTSGAEGGSKAPLAERVRHPHELQLDPSLRIDVEWYKRQQVHPLVSRLLAPVEGTDAARVAECLGLDGTRFAQAAAAQEAAEAGENDAAYVRMAANDVNALFDRKIRWKDYTTRLPGIKCLKCQETTTWKQLLQPEVWEANGVNAMFCCSKCPEHVKPKRAQNAFVVQVRSLLKEHCEGWVQCTGDECIEKTRRLSCGQNIVGARMILRELEYMEYLCEAEACYAGQDQRGCREAAIGMKRTAKWLLQTNGFNWVDCGQIFTGIFGDS